MDGGSIKNVSKWFCPQMVVLESELDLVHTKAAAIVEHITVDLDILISLIYATVCSYIFTQFLAYALNHSDLTSQY